MRKAVKIMLGVVAGAGAFSLAVTPALGDIKPPPYQLETFADIDCNVITPGHWPALTTRAWGTGYPAGEKFVVRQVVLQKSEPWQEEKHEVGARFDGSWTTPTTTYHTRDRTLYELQVTVFTPEGKDVDSASDSCTLE